MKIPFTTLDVFTSTRYRGNALAIVLPPTPSTLTQSQKQSIANEFDLSETVILHLPPSTSSTSSPPTEITIDIFTSHIEIPFAGHPTIGSAFFVLNYLNLNTVTALITKAGRIPISRIGERVRAEVPFDVHVHALETSCELQASGGSNPTVSIVNGMAFTYVLLPDLETLARAHETGNLHQDTYTTDALDEGWRAGLVGTMYYVFVGEDADEEGKKVKKYRTRMFATEEDPGTGSASSGLGVWLAGLEEGEGEGEYRYGFEQGVEMGRRNEIWVDVETGGEAEGKEMGLKRGIKKVWLSGEAVRVMEGELEI
ncbi:Phenazine biosynthesis protein [Rutstroemia sp. NJR-2017a BVV2]|nr:Phenazine biosynthesis protein [Rutstroemia sp. NJR-2017a BVV2]